MYIAKGFVLKQIETIQCTYTLPLVQESNSLSTCLWLLEYMYIANGFVLKQKPYSVAVAIFLPIRDFQGRIHDFWKGGSYVYRCGGFALLIFISFFLNVPLKWNNLVSLRPNYFIFIGSLKTGAWEGGSSQPLEHPLDPPLTFIYL